MRLHLFVAALLLPLFAVEARAQSADASDPACAAQETRCLYQLPETCISALGDPVAALPARCAQPMISYLECVETERAACRTAAPERDDTAVAHDEPEWMSGDPKPIRVRFVGWERATGDPDFHVGDYQIGAVYRVGRFDAEPGLPFTVFDDDEIDYWVDKTAFHVVEPGPARPTPTDVEREWMPGDPKPARVRFLGWDRATGDTDYHVGALEVGEIYRVGEFDGEPALPFQVVDGDEDPVWVDKTAFVIVPGPAVSEPVVAPPVVGGEAQWMPGQPKPDQVRFLGWDRATGDPSFHVGDYVIGEVYRIGQFDGSPDLPFTVYDEDNIDFWVDKTAFSVVGGATPAPAADPVAPPSAAGQWMPGDPKPDQVRFLGWDRATGDPKFHVGEFVVGEVYRTGAFDGSPNLPFKVFDERDVDYWVDKTAFAVVGAEAAPAPAPAPAPRSAPTGGEAEWMPGDPKPAEVRFMGWDTASGDPDFHVGEYVVGQVYRTGVFDGSTDLPFTVFDERGSDFWVDKTAFRVVSFE